MISERGLEYLRLAALGAETYNDRMILRTTYPSILAMYEKIIGVGDETGRELASGIDNRGKDEARLREAVGSDVLFKVHGEVLRQAYMFGKQRGYLTVKDPELAEFLRDSSDHEGFF